MAKMRVDKLLSHVGMGSRSEVKKAVKFGWVTVNGIVIKDSGLLIDTDADAMTFNGQAIHYQEFYYLMMNKPQDVVSATEDKRDKTVIDLLPEPYNRLGLFPVGRLDKDTEGLLLLTNDGDLTHSLLSPKKKVPKVYQVTLDKPVSVEGIQKLEAGIPLEDKFTTSPAVVELLDDTGVFLNLTIFEGRFHQVKRMMEYVECTVIGLKRIKMGEMVLDPELESGAWKEIGLEDIDRLLGR